MLLRRVSEFVHSLITVFISKLLSRLIIKLSAMETSSAMAVCSASAKDTGWNRFIQAVTIKEVDLGFRPCA